MTPAALPITVTPDNLDFVLERAPEIVFLRFPDHGDDEVVYRDRAREVLRIMLDVTSPVVVYHCIECVFAITF